MAAKNSLSGLGAAILFGTVLLLVSPVPAPDPFGLRPNVTWALICTAAAAAIALCGVLTGASSRSSVDWLIAAYAAAVALTAIPSVDRHATLTASLTVAAEIGLLYSGVLIARLRPSVTPWLLMAIIAAIAVVELMAFGFHLEAGLMMRPKEYSVPEGWAGYPELGALAVIAFGMIIALAMTASRAWAAAAAMGLLLILSAELVFLYSRTAWLAAVVVVLAALAISGRHVKRLLVAASIVTIIGGGAALASPTLRFLALNLFTGVVGAQAGGRQIDVASPSTRLSLWTKTADMIADSPLYGVGLGNFRSVFERDYNPELNDDQRRGVHAHNLWLQKAAEIGVPGGLVYSAIWAVVLFRACRNARRLPIFTTVGVFLALAGTAASELTDNVPYTIAGLRVYLVTWVLFGLALGADPVRNEAFQGPGSATQ